MLKTLIKANKRIPSFVLLLLIILFWSFTGQQIPDKLINSISEVVPTTKEVLVSKNKVKRVIDGDTIELENGQKVRYIGIDTPERNECFNKQATAKNKELVLGKTVKLVKDVSNADKYGRLLRYVYVDEIFVNLYLVKNGLAVISTYPPDVFYQQELLEAQKQARTKQLGLWAKNVCEFF